MAVRRKQIRAMVENLLQRNRVSDGAIPIERIASAMGIEITKSSVDDALSGFLVRDKKNKRTIIGANKSHHPNRQRFTIAHELGHYLLHEGEPVHLDDTPQAFTIKLRDQDSAKGEEDDEKEANLFAAEILMPAKFLAHDLKGKEFDLLADSAFLSKLAEKYKVSVQALTFRLAYLNYIKI